MQRSRGVQYFRSFRLFPSSTLLPVLTGFKAKLESIHRRYEEILGNIIEEHVDKKLANNAGDEDLEDVLRFHE